MITSLRIQNFQSLVDVELELKPFTVIVGPSSSGKTACVRALRVLHENSRGAPFVTHGAKQSSVALSRTGAAITLDRGPQIGRYSLDQGQGVVEFTKLGAGVPEAVQDALGNVDASLQIVSQFDKPFLLDNTGGEVARVLGELTNVDLIFSAVREANRRKLEISSLVKVRQSDLAQIVESAQKFKTLKSRVVQLGLIEESNSRIEALESQYADLLELLMTFISAQEAAANPPRVVVFPELGPVENKIGEINKFLNVLSVWASAQAVLSLLPVRIDLPDWNLAYAAKKALDEYQSLVKRLVVAQNEVVEFSEKAEDVKRRLVMLENSHRELLVKSGICPTCQQPTIDLA